MSDQMTPRPEEVKITKAEATKEESANAVDAATVAKLTEEKIAAEQRAKDLEKKLSQIREDSKKRDEEIEAIKKSLEEAKKKSMSKEELEAAEKRELIESLAKKDSVIEELKKTAQEANLQATKVLVAQEKGLPSGLLSFVRGASEDEIRSEIDKLLAETKKATQPGVVTTNKVTELGSNSTANTGGQGLSGQSGEKPSVKNFQELRTELLKRGVTNPKQILGR